MIEKKLEEHGKPWELLDTQLRFRPGTLNIKVKGAAAVSE